MSAGVISRRYAKALMNLAVQDDRLEAVGGGLDVVADAMADNPRLGAFLQDVKVPLAAKKEAVAELLKAAQVPPLVDTFVRFLTHKRRIVLLGQVRDVFHRLADERMGRAKAELVVAAPVSEAQEQAVLARLEAISGKQVTLTVRVDPDILGGAVTRIGSAVHDGSLRSHLNTLRQSILEG